ncbi:barwin-like endoglucanase [Ceratobasidium sp. AG-I]|nr:barwin-like endoglucanase [Ceratobasidium sp. AG-I]
MGYQLYVYPNSISKGDLLTCLTSTDSPSEGRGACGWNNKDSEHVVAIGKALWEETSHGGTSSLCGKTAAVTWHGKTVNVRVVDECPVCGHDNIDLSPSAFEQLGDKNIGKLDGVSWKFV